MSLSRGMLKFVPGSKQQSEPFTQNLVATRRHVSNHPGGLPVTVSAIVAHMGGCQIYALFLGYPKH